MKFVICVWHWHIIIQYTNINIDKRTRGHTKKLLVKRCHYDVRQNSFCITVVNIWNSLPNDAISATSVNSFKNRLDLFWADEEVLYLLFIHV